MNILGLINIKYFLIALFVGLIYIYFNDDKRKIIIYPTLSNNDKVEFRDNAFNCYKYNMKEVKCPMNKNSIKNIPIQ